MNTIIEKIRTEVERRKKKAEHYIEVCKVSKRPFEYWSGQKDVLELFEKEFLDTLQEQPVDWQKVAEAHAKDQPLGQDNDGNLVYLQEHPVKPSVEDAMKELDKKIAKATKSWKGVDVDKMLAECRGYDEQPVSEGLEDVADTLAEEHGFVKKPDFKPAKYSWSAVRDVFIEGVIAGAKWQKKRLLPMIDNICKVFRIQHEKENPVCEGLEEEIKRYYSDNFAYLSSDQPTLSILTNVARHFARWGAVHIRKVTKNVGCSSEIPKDLESYAQMVENYYDVGEERGYLCVHRGEIKSSVIAGAEWQKEQDTRERIMSDGSYFQKCYELGKKDMKEQNDKELSEKIAASYQLGLADKEKQMMKEAVEGWVARDGFDNTLCFFSNKPHRPDIQEPLKVWKMWLGGCFHLPKQLFHDLKWEDEPKKVKLIIVKED